MILSINETLTLKRKNIILLYTQPKQNSKPRQAELSQYMCSSVTQVHANLP